MSDVKILIYPRCGGHKIIENQALIAKTMRVDKPGDVPREVELTMYTCLDCGSTFSELEGSGE